LSRAAERAAAVSELERQAHPAACSLGPAVSRYGDGQRCRRTSEIRRTRVRAVLSICDGSTARTWV
ncbi:hypothetical protein ACFWNT_19660, partial [Streptomyces sp. NPDC058409]|uniref:hypothetical protein n=1 Tax=Streptomyces sp. NPDC058409 TaxID=3346484 RepID=UPI00365F774B